MAGGTGGHIFPALAIAEILQTKNIKVHWLGTKLGLEAQLIPAADIPIDYINIAGMRGKKWLTILTAPFKIMYAIWQSIRILRQIKPVAVIGMGGFVSGPGGIAAWLSRIPLFIHEQNAIPGLTNRWLTKLAQGVMESFPNTFPAKKHILYTGNPLRNNITELSSQKLTTVHKPLHILILGGSLGAKILNETVPIALKQLAYPIEVRHQTGRIHIEAMQTAYKDVTFAVQIMPFIEDMASAYLWADLVICRAGAMTISELAQMGLASILVPYPYAVDDHQTHNAQFLVATQAAILLPQTKLSVTKLVNLIENLISNPKRLEKMAIAAKSCATPVASQIIVDTILTSINY